MTPPTYKFGYWNAEFRPLITLDHCPENKYQQVWIQDEMHVVYRVGNTVFRPSRTNTGNRLPVQPKQLTLVEQPHFVTDINRLPSHRIILARKMHVTDQVDYLWFHVDGIWYSARCELVNSTEHETVEKSYAFETTVSSPVVNRFTVTDYVAVWQTTYLKIAVKPPTPEQQAEDKQRNLDAAIEEIRAVAADDAMRRQVDSQEMPVTTG